MYFPRLAMPISTVISGLINFLVQFALFFILLLVYLASGARSARTGACCCCVPLVLQVGLLGLGCGIIVSSLTTRYRDLMVVVTFGVQLWMYGSPVVYPLSMITHPSLRAVMVINPMTAPMEKLPLYLLRHRAGHGRHVGVVADLDRCAAGAGTVAFQQGRKDLRRYGVRGRICVKIR